MNSINFDNAYLLLLAIPVIALFAVPFALAVRKGNINGHNVASLVLHIALAIVIAFASAGPKITIVQTQTQVYIVADVSYSASKNLDTVDNYIHSIKLPENSKVGLVCFGKNYELLSELTSKDNIPSVKNSKVDDGETNIIDALDYTSTLFDDNVIKRIVLITDGKQTDERDDYALSSAVQSLVNKNIKVDAIFLDDNLGRDKHEVQISAVNFNHSAYVGSDETAEITVRSNYETQGILEVYADGTMTKEVLAELTDGQNIISFGLDTQKSGVFGYEVRLVADGDTSGINNNIGFTQTVSDEFKVLFVTQNWTDCTAAVEQYVERYGEKAAIDVYENDLTVNISVKDNFINKYAPSHAGEDRSVNIFALNVDVPYGVEDLMTYDEIVLSNVDLTQLNNYTSFITNIDTVVSMFGKSLVTVGNLFIRNRDIEELNKLSDMLPVKFGNETSDPKLYAIALDASRDMQLFRFIVAKQAISNLIDILGRNDEICVVTFFSDVRVAIPPTPIANESDREAIKQAVNDIDVTQGTLIGAGLGEASNLLKDLTYGEKQVMLISDGLNYSYDNAVEIAAQMYDDEIITSVFDVGREGGNNAENEQAKQMLMNIAQSGGGKYVFSNNAENLDEEKFGEMADFITGTVIERKTSVNVERRKDEILGGILDASEGLPDIDGYINAETKASATTVLTVNHKRASSTTEKPLYAYRKYGNGRVASFTSSLYEYLSGWGEETRRGFVSNLFSANVPSAKISAPFDIRVERSGKFMRMEVTPAQASSDAKARVEILSPGFSAQPVKADMEFNSRYYHYEFEAPYINPAARVNTYKITFVYETNDKTYSEIRYVDVTYNEEYDEFAVFDASVLHKAIDGKGTVSEDGALELVNDEKEAGTRTVELMLPLLVVAAVLFVVDVIVRKLKWEDIRSFFGFGKKDRKEGKK